MMLAADKQETEEPFQEDEELQGFRMHRQLVMVLEIVVRVLLWVLVLLVVVVVLPLDEVQLVMELHNPLYILVVVLQVLGQEDAFAEAFLAARAEVLQAVWHFAEELHLVKGVRLAVQLQVDVDLA